MSFAPLDARIVRRLPLLYRRGPDPDLDRPAYVRAASGLCWVGDALVVVQDDARFIGVVDPHDAQVDDHALPRGPGDRRVFDNLLGNKPDKPDLEIAVCDGARLVAFGSGGPLPARQGIVTWTLGEDPIWTAFPWWFERIAGVAGHPLNLEGGEILGDTLVLAQRGGHVTDGIAAPDVLVSLPLGELHALLRGERHDGALRGVPLAFGDVEGSALHVTDLCRADDGLWVSAVAELTDDFYGDGPVRGAAIGLIADPLGDPTVHLTRVRAEDGAPALDKIEGIAQHPTDPTRLYAVTDPDDPTRPGELLEISLRLRPPR